MNTYSVYYGIEELEHKGWDNYDYYSDWEYLGLYNGNRPSDAVLSAMNETGRYFGTFKVSLFVYSPMGHVKDDVKRYEADGRLFAETGMHQYKIFANEGRGHCVRCAKETLYKVRQEWMKGKVDEKDYSYVGLEARCSECGMIMKIPEIDSGNRLRLTEASEKAKALEKEKEEMETDFVKKK